MKFIELLQAIDECPLTEGLLDALPPGARRLGIALAIASILSGAAHGHESDIEHPAKHPPMSRLDDLSDRLMAMSDIISQETDANYGDWTWRLQEVYEEQPERFKRMWGVNYEEFIEKARESTPEEMGAIMRQIAQSIQSGEELPRQLRGLTEAVDFDPLRGKDLGTPGEPRVYIYHNNYRKRAVKPRRARNDVLMTIPTPAMEQGFKRDAGFYVGPGGTGAAIGDRYRGFQEWIAQNREYEVPEIYVDERGIVSFSNGRHRYAVLRDGGVDPMPVAVAPEAVRNAQQLLGGKIQE